MKNKKTSIISLIIIVGSIVFGFIYLGNYYNLIPKKVYSASDFNIKTIKSELDFNDNGTDDYMDIMLGARIDATNKPKYDGSYHSDGYPPNDIGVCTDLVWRAFKNAGYNLKEMIDLDIENRLSAYPNIDKIDKNIDFRRVKNLHVFFKEYTESLSINPKDIEEWQAGDIVIFKNDHHIGIISDKRNKDGLPYVIHNGGQPNREEDYLKRDTVIGHYRFDATNIPSDLLIKWD